MDSYYIQGTHIRLVVQPHSIMILVSQQKKIFDIWWVQIKNLVSTIISARTFLFLRNLILKREEARFDQELHQVEEEEPLTFEESRETFSKAEKFAAQGRADTQPFLSSISRVNPVPNITE